MMVASKYRIGAVDRRKPSRSMGSSIIHSMYYPVRAGDEPALFICYEVRERNKSFLSDATMATQASRDPATGQVPVSGV